MNGARRLLICSALILAVWGMSFGFWYAVWVEHQALDAMGGQLSTAFMLAAARDLPGAHASLDAYAATAFKYVRHVDIHSHWSGLSLMLLVLGLGFEGVGFGDRQQFYLALGLSAGSALFPLGVMLQTVMSGWGPGILAAIGAALVMISLSAVTLGFARVPRQETRSDVS
jgi:hypothetical protein